MLPGKPTAMRTDAGPEHQTPDGTTDTVTNNAQPDGTANAVIPDRTTDTVTKHAQPNGTANAIIPDRNAHLEPNIVPDPRSQPEPN